MKLYGLIGYPLGHSFSKKYFTEKFQKEGLTGVGYELFSIASIQELPSVLHANPQLSGLNVTIPYKEKVLQYVTEMTPAVKEIGAANTITIDGDTLIAWNTDVIGFERSFTKKLKSHHKKALVLGSGGSSKAVQYVLKKLDIAYKVVTRNKQNKEGVIAYGDLNETIMSDHTIIINCTPAGLYPNIGEYPQILYEFITARHYLFDLIYRPEKTAFLQMGEARGADIQNGYEMLVTQAEESWKIWND